MSELLRCPFCGGEAYYTETVNGSSMAYVGCSPCGVHTKAALVPAANGEAWSRDIIAVWNTRSEPPADLGAAVEALEPVEKETSLGELRQWCEARAIECGSKAEDPTIAERLRLGWAMSADTFACVIEKIDDMDTANASPPDAERAAEVYASLSRSQADAASEGGAA